MKKFTLVLIGVILFLVVGHQFYLFTKYWDDLGGCGFSSGPYLGQEVNLSLDTVTIDEYVAFPEASFAFLHVSDELAPIMLKLDEKDNVIWAVRLNTSDSANWVQMWEMTNFSIGEENEHKVIHFFNVSRGEPGSIYLTDKFEFEYMCLSPM